MIIYIYIHIVFRIYYEVLIWGWVKSYEITPYDWRKNIQPKTSYSRCVWKWTMPQATCFVECWQYDFIDYGTMGWNRVFYFQTNPQMK